nr:MAG TPA: holin [Caudoviricetes sp.]
MNEMNKILDSYNLAVGGIVTLLAAIFGKYWYLFAIFLLLNLFDYVTGYMKARKLKKESSSVGLAGIVKKLGYWIIIATAFLTAYALTALGKDILHIDLSFLALLGWFTLGCLLINEVRSILENLVEYGLDVPYVLIKGLAVTERLLNETTDSMLGKGEDETGEK